MRKIAITKKIVVIKKPIDRQRRIVVISIYITNV